MRKLPIFLLLVLLAGAGCTSTRSNWPYPDRRDHPRRQDTRRADPVVGRTTDGRRIYEDRRTGRIYTVDRVGRRVYQDRAILQRQRSSTVGGKNHGTYRGNGRKNGHWKHDRDDRRHDRRDDDHRRGRGHDH